MDKCEKERQILDLAIPLLEKLYGEFEIDETQIDRPDAAIILKKNEQNVESHGEHKKIGIEITSVDKPDDLQYLNDEKITRDVILDQINGLELGVFSLQSNKKTSIEVSNTYVSEAVLKKLSKYNSYHETGNYTELIILAFSEYLEINAEFEYYQEPWANYWLSENDFPFDKVIFVYQRKVGAKLIYDKENPKKEMPKTEEVYGREIVQSAIIPMGIKVPFYPFSSEAPLVLKGEKVKRRKKQF